MSAPVGWQKGSFRGVPFRTEDSDTLGGRRGVLHEFPQGEKPVWEDLGRAAHSFSFQCHVVGADHIAQANALADALDAPGPGTLVHPWLGAMQVAVPSYARIDSTVDGGFSRFSIEFLESGLPVPPPAANDTQADANAAADVAAVGAVEGAGRGINVAGAIALVEQAAAEVTRYAGLAVQAQAALAGGTGPMLRFLLANLSLLGDAGALLRAPLTLGLTMVRAIQTLAIVARPIAAGSRAGSFAGAAQPVAAGSSSPLYGAGSIIPTFPVDQVVTPAMLVTAGLRPVMMTQAQATPVSRGLRILMDFGSALSPVPPTTPGRRIQAANQAAIVQLVNLAAASELVRCHAATAFVSYDDAVAARDDAADRLDMLALRQADVGDDAGAAQYDALRRAVTADLTARGGSLARLQAHVPAATLPALVIAQRLYGDPATLEARAAEIVARNRVRHPGFVPGGVTLQVLSVEADNG